MKNSKHSFGQLLAYVEATIKNNETVNLADFSAHEKKIFQLLQEMSSKVNEFSNILESVPGHECRHEKPFLDNNENFYLSIILKKNSNENFKKNCLKLSKHLNDCFRCFEIFHQTMRDYYNKSSELTQS